MKEQYYQMVEYAKMVCIKGKGDQNRMQSKLFNRKAT